jgi:hypothetical protein
MAKYSRNFTNNFSRNTVSYSVSVNGQATSPKEYKIQQINTDNTQPLKLTFEEHHSAFFEVNPTNNANQEDFYIKISNVTSGKYKVIITATNDYNFESEELTHDITIPTTDIESDVIYKITIISTSTAPFLADVSITSKADELE